MKIIDVSCSGIIFISLIIIFCMISKLLLILLIMTTLRSAKTVMFYGNIKTNKQEELQFFTCKN